MDIPRARRARAGTNPDVIRRVAALLAARWDPDAEFAAPDGARTAEAHAAAVLGVLSAGGSRAEVVGYLRCAEEDLLVFPRSTAEQRWALAEELRNLVLDTPVVGDAAP